MKSSEVVFKAPPQRVGPGPGPTPRQQDHIQGNLTIKCPHCSTAYCYTAQYSRPSTLFRVTLYLELLVDSIEHKLPSNIVDIERIAL